MHIIDTFFLVILVTKSRVIHFVFNLAVKMNAFCLKYANDGYTHRYYYDDRNKLDRRETGNDGRSIII